MGSTAEKCWRGIQKTDSLYTEQKWQLTFTFSYLSLIQIASKPTGITDWSF